MDLRHPYLTEQLIAYIGNKRALLPFLHGAFQGLADGRSGLVFSDPFCGSGAVSRLARLMGFRVLANDWERYSFVINSCYLGVEARELAGLFGERGGLEAVLAELAGLAPPAPEERYISRHFAPARTSEADWRRERLFYTSENALVIDAVRERIERMYPGTPSDPKAFKEKMVLLAPLLYEAATHTNTSGVFKAYHRGFGGHGGDALGRITAAIRPRPPVLVDCPFVSRVFCEDAERFVSSHGADVCYLDPPYADHQYGSNYFMLTTIALWDRPEVSDERGPDGRLKEKAGIRKDWVVTRSAFCSRRTAPEAFRRLAAAADCRYLCVSYSDEGLLSPEDLADILAETGSLAVHAKDNVKYPGGKQSIGRTVRNLELLLVVDRKSRPGVGEKRRLEKLMREARLEKLLRSAFHPGRIAEAFPQEGDSIVFRGPSGKTTVLPMITWHRFEVGKRAVTGLSSRDAEALLGALSPCRIADRREGIEVLLALMDGGMDTGALKEILRLLKGFAHRKYTEEFRAALESLMDFSARGEVPEWFRQGLARIEETAVKRFGFTS